MKMNDIKKIGLIEIEKPEGAQIFERVNLSDKQRKKKEDELQMRLIELTPST